MKRFLCRTRIAELLGASETPMRERLSIAIDRIDYFRADRHTAAARKATGAAHAQTQAVMTGSPAWAWPWKPGGGCGGVNLSFQFMWRQRVISCTMIIQLPIHRPPLAHCRRRCSGLQRARGLPVFRMP
jgi:hypothetical protein